MTDMITISAGGPPPDADITDGVYPVILIDIKEPRSVHVTRGERAGQDMDLRDWVFAIDQPGHPLDGRVIDSATSTASGPKSKQFSYLTALFNGIAPTVGSSFGKADIVGRRAIATIQHDDGGYPKIVNLGAMPVAMQQAGFAQTTAVPTAAPVAAPQAIPGAQPVAAAPVATSEDSLPF